MLRSFLSLVAAIHLIASAFSADGHLTFYLDNDLFANTDQDYTNGWRLSYISNEPWEALKPTQDALNELSADENSWYPLRALFGFDDKSQVSRSYGIAITQLMFTPEDPAASVTPPGQRPYAGWMGLGISAHAKDKKALNSVELAIGVVGPDALAENFQDFIHAVRDIVKFDGWDSQVPNEITVNLYLERKRRIGGEQWFQQGNFSMDAFGEWGVALGNFRTNGYVGGLARIGWNLPVEFSDPRLSERAHTQRLFDGGEAPSSKWSLYAIGGFRGTAVAHDATLDGPLFRDFETNVDSEAFVGELYLGGGARLGGFELSYIHTFRSKEFAEADGGQQFGSIAARIHF